MNGLTLLALLALAIGVALAFRAWMAMSRRVRATPSTELRPAVTAAVASAAPSPPSLGPSETAGAETVVPAVAAAEDRVDAAAPASQGIALEQSRLVRSLVAENASLRERIAAAAAAEAHMDDLAEDRRRLFADLAAARSETARYRGIVIDLENNAAPPLLDGHGAPDDLKLIVGIGPVLERMLQQMGITSYRQIARWSERDIEDFDARLAEFPGRIRRDAWVTQARSLHQSKYGEALPVRDR